MPHGSGGGPSTCALRCMYPRFCGAGCLVQSREVIGTAAGVPLARVKQLCWGWAMKSQRGIGDENTVQRGWYGIP